MVRMCASLLFTLFASCSLYQGAASDWYTSKDYFSGLSSKANDYSEHLSSLAHTFASSEQSSQLKLTRKSKKYLEGLYKRIVENNKKILGNAGDSQFIILNNKIPFIFSFPGAYFFLSSGLVASYLEHEEILVAAITHEIIRSQLNIYKKKKIVPIGHIETERAISLTRIDLILKMKVNKWTYYAMNRAGFDGFGYLLWVQIQNKNALDFLLQLGDLQNISKEEYLFKSFIAGEMKKEEDNVEKEMHSSKGFYAFRAYVKNKVVHSE